MWIHAQEVGDLSKIDAKGNRLIRETTAAMQHLEPTGEAVETALYKNLLARDGRG